MLRKGSWLQLVWFCERQINRGRYITKFLHRFFQLARYIYIYSSFSLSLSSPNISQCQVTGTNNLQHFLAEFSIHITAFDGLVREVKVDARVASRLSIDRSSRLRLPGRLRENPHSSPVPSPFGVLAPRLLVASCGLQRLTETIYELYVRFGEELIQRQKCWWIVPLPKFVILRDYVFSWCKTERR